MGMYAKFRHVSVRELKAAEKEPAKFYRNLYGLEGKPADRSMMLQSLGHQIGAAIKASPLAKEFTDMPEARRLAEATMQGKSPDPSDQEALARKVLELLPAIGFRPNHSKFVPRATKIPKGLELEKSWHCLHFMLSGKVWKTGKAAIGKAILGGAEIPDVEGVMGYGSVRYLEPGEVKKITVALERYPIERAAARFDPRAASAAKVYCPNHSPEELVYYFNMLTKYYREAASREHAMLLWIE
ncbi:MAG TPA: DUF1877 family protein [Candidatus Solibacter sp.]|nr:DUF1877 family protein [Candidatus Solibacter sp.]